MFIFWNFSKFWYRFHLSPKVKRKVISTIRSFLYKSSHELPDNFRHRILGKSQICKGTQPNAQSQNIWCWRLKIDKMRYYSFRLCLTLFDFSIFLKIFCPGLSGGATTLTPVYLKRHYFDLFQNFMVFLRPLQQKLKQLSFEKFQIKQCCVSIICHVWFWSKNLICNNFRWWQLF